MYVEKWFEFLHSFDEVATIEIIITMREQQRIERTQQPSRKV